MRSTTILAVAFLLGTLFISCENKSEKSIEKIEALQKSIIEMGPQNELPSAEYRQTSAELLSAYNDFMGQYPDDEHCADFLFDAGSMSITLAAYEDAINYFDKLLEKYPDDELAPDALYHTAYIYEKFIEDIGLARTRYQMVLDQYPELAEERNVALQIQYLGNDEDLFNAILQKAESDSSGQ